ncbi:MULTISPECIES: alpha/beta fold hydrolase [unclassified Rhodococcus (in: high G+C Gram-positive bacteria)]|uniref:alpha/beta fold hydrolase n=1 Tax=Rhodococcus sp. SJ-3 TaxID=3454628 RepID=UPI003F7B0D92
MSEYAARTDSRTEHPPPARPRYRWLRRSGLVVLAALTALGAVSVQQFFFGAPGVGHFRDAEGRQSYVAAYEQAMSSLPSPTSTHDLATRFGTVRAYEWSSPDTADTVPVVLVPGRSSGVPMWAENLDDFLPHRRVVAFDALGDAGLSVQNVPLTSFGDQAIWITDALDALATDTVHIVGHSFGGAIAATYAQHFPERVRSLTLLEPVFTFARPSARMMAWTMVSSLPFLPESWRTTALGKVGGAEFDSNDDMAKMIAAGSEHFSAVLPIPSPLSDDEMEALAMPTYVAIAERDSLAGGDTAVQRARTLPRALVDIFPNTTHSLPMQAKEALAVELPEFWHEAEQN